MQSLILAPSLLSADFAQLGAELARAEAAGADWHHVDVMDGNFVPNLTLGAPVVASLSKHARIPLDVHLMIREPLRYAADYAKAGARVLTFHIETCSNASGARQVIEGFRAAGIAQVGISLNPDTEVERLAGLLSSIDLVLVMSVFPGFGGQRFMPEVLPKAQALRAMGFAGRLEIDGGVNRATIADCARAGFDSFVMGSALYGAADMAAEASLCRRLAQEARGKSSTEPRTPA